MASRDDGIHVIQQVLDQVAELHHSLTKAMAQLELIEDDEVGNYLETQAWFAKDSYAMQLALWRKLLEPQGAESALGGVEASLRTLESSTSMGKKANIKQRLAGMGATPALGNGVVLPAAVMRQMSSLHVTASPAAREIFLNRHGVELRSPGMGTPAGSRAQQQQQQDTSPPWMEELKSKKPTHSAVTTPRDDRNSGMPALQSELGSVLAKRAASLKSMGSIGAGIED